MKTKHLPVIPALLGTVPLSAGLVAGLLAAPVASAVPCTTASFTGACGPYPLTGPHRTMVIQDAWHPAGLRSQVLTAWGAGHWRVTANAVAGNRGVLSYPDTATDFTKPTGLPVPLSSFAALTSVYDIRMPSDVGAAGSSDHYEAAYDLWLAPAGRPAVRSAEQEVMVWGDERAVSPADAFTGLRWTDPSTRQVYRAYRRTGAAGPLVEMLRVTSNIHAGVNLKALLSWLAARRLTSAGALASADFGFEVRSTSSRPEVFSVNELALTAVCAAARPC